MTSVAAKDLDGAIGRSPEQLTLEQRRKLAGLFIALEIYSPATLPLRRIEAIGATAADCFRMLKTRGLDPEMFEYSRLTAAY